MIGTKIIGNDLIKRQVEEKPLVVQLVDAYGNPMPMETLIFNVNGQNYERNTNDNGKASLNIRLPVSSYTCTITFNSVHVYSGSTATVNVKVVERYETKVTSSDLTKNRETPAKLNAKLTLYNGEVIPNRPLLFHINGVYYTRTTDNNGIAGLNINLPRGVYSCEIMSPYDDYYEYSSTTVTVTVISSTHMDGTNISKMEDETAVYQCAVYDELGRVDCTVTITVNGVTYTRHTESDGLAKLNIRLPKGEYDIIAKFAGDASHTGSQVVNHISSKPYAEELTRNVNGVWIPEDNTGFMESHVQVKQWSPETAEAKGGVLFWDDTGQTFHKDIPFTSYEITETDPRVKTAKFTTSEYFDLTDGQLWVHISSPYHENFGGRILKVDFDKDKGLYNYQCQDGRRNYMNKFKYVINKYSTNVYWSIMSLLMTPFLPDYPNVTPTDLDKYLNHKIISGLRPIEAYDLQSGVIKQNAFEQFPETMLSYDSVMDKIMNFAHYGGTPTDVYFTPEGICQIEPIDINTWIKTGFKLTHSDLISYKYGFDTTNILTGVNFQTDLKDNTPIVNIGKGTTVNQELSKLGFYFGANIGMISPVTESVEGETSTGSSSSGGGGSNVFVDMGKPHTFAVGADNIDGNEYSYINRVISALESKGHSAYSLGVGPSVNQNHGLSGSSNGEINIFIVGGICAGTVKDYADGLGSYYNYDGMIMMFANCTTDNWISCNALKSKNQVRAHDDGFSTGIDTSITPHEMFERHSDKIAYIAGQPNEGFDSLVNKLVNGEFNCGNSTSSSSGSSTQQINVSESYNKALEEVVKVGRDLLSFEVKLPLNHPMFKNLHTNQMFFTELPKDFKLGNLSELFKILPTYKINRGLGTEYQENRWYIEKQVIKCDSNGLFSTLTLNVLPSSYSVYTKKLREYHNAYEQATKQQQNKSSSNSSGRTGQARLGDDSTDTNSMACATGRYHGHAGDNENFDECAKKGYARQGASYFDWSRQFNTPIELAKALNDRIEYHYYEGNEDGNAEQTFNAGAGNCYDGCRLVKCCMDAAGFDCIVVTGTIYQGGHGWNAVKWNGRWYTFDLTYDYTSAGDWGGTNTLRMTNEW